MTDFLGDSKWIWSPTWGVGDDAEAGIWLFRKTLDIKGAVREAALRISADTRYKLYINGALVEVGPGRGDNQIWFYDAMSIVPYLHEGANVLAVAVLRYPLDPAKGNHGMFRTATPGLFLTGQIVDEGGEVYRIDADSTWKCKKEAAVAFYREEERFAPLMIHERAMGNRETFGWRYADYNDGAWEQAKV
jgi:hypothetical protein